MDSNTTEEKRTRWLTHKAPQNSLDFEKFQTTKDARTLETTNVHSTAHSNPLGSGANLEFKVQSLRSRHKTNTKPSKGAS